MKTKKVLALLLAATTLASFTACGKSGDSNNSQKDSSDKSSKESTVDSKEEKLDYTYGIDKTFKSDEPIKYSMMYSDHENYPYKEDWLFWSKLTEMTNVSFELKMIPRADYDDKKSLLINGGESSYIIPKTYDESAFVTGGAVVAVSDWVEYMPNYMKFVEDYKLEDDLKIITKEDGKYYRLPGMWAEPKSEYTWVIRKDIFDAAGVDITALEKNYTWDTFSEALEKVAKANPGKTVWSDRWKGEAGLKVIGDSYDVPAGWAKNDGMSYDAEKDEFYFAEVTDDCKNMCKMLNNLVENGIIDKETFTQEDSAAEEKFYNGKSFMIGSNESMLGTYASKMNETLGEGKFELYSIVPPAAEGKENYLSENSRLENGIMISTKALEELGKDGFIKMLRFVDWLWYSPEGHTFVKWGVEGETYTVENGTKTLKPEIGYGAINPDATKKLNVDYGFSNGVFMYGGTTENRTSMLSDALKDYYTRINSIKKIRPLKPAVAFSEEDTEQMNLIKSPLMDYVNTSVLQFITGQSDIDENWDTFVQKCKSNNYEKYVTMYNDTYKSSK